MIYVFIVLHLIVCLFLVVVVLLQSGKAADLAGAFGAMGSQTAFGPRGAATVLSKATTVAAGLFMLTSLSLAILTTRNAGGASVLQKVDSKLPAAAQPKAAAPAAQPSIEIVPPGQKEGKKVPIQLPPNPNQQPAAPAPAPQR